MESEKFTGRLTVEERYMIRDLILLPYIDTMVEKAMREFEISGNLLTNAGLSSGEYIRNRIVKDTFELQKELKRRNIKIVDDENDNFLLYYMIYYRGYQERFGMTRDVMRTEISLRLTKYTADFGELMKSQNHK